MRLTEIVSWAARRTGAALLGVCIAAGTFAAPPSALAGTKNDGAVVMDAETGKILYERRADLLRAPASLTKVMTVYMLFEEMRKGRFTLDSQLPVSRNAQNQKPSKLGVKRGESISVEEAIYALIVKSGNDVAVVVAEAIAGSESAFAAQMTARARSIGMSNTTFRNASGLPDDEQRTTARDMATMSRAVMRDFPEYFHYFSATQFTWNGKTVRGHNSVTREVPGANGLKTGYTRYSGFNLASSVERNGKRVIGVVLGGDSANLRDEEMKTMLEAWFVALESRPHLVASYSGARGSAPAVLVAEAPRAAEPEVQVLTPSQPMVASVAAVPTPVIAAEDEEAAEVQTFSEAVPVLPAPEPQQDILLAMPEPEREALTQLAAQVEADEPIVANVPVVAAKPVKLKTMRNAPIPAPKPRAIAGRSGEEVPVIAAARAEDDVRPLSSLNGPKEDMAELIEAKVPVRKPLAEPSAVEAWSIQLGAFSSKKAAKAQIDAAKKASKALRSGGEPAVEAIKNSKGKTLYRARIVALDSKTARSACKSLNGKGIDCVTVSDEQASAN